MFGFGLGGQEIALIGLAVLVLFGAKKLPEVFRSMGQGIAEFKRASREVFRELEEDRPSLPERSQPPGAGSPSSPSGETAASAEEQHKSSE